MYSRTRVRLPPPPDFARAPRELRLGKPASVAEALLQSEREGGPHSSWQAEFTCQVSEHIIRRSLSRRSGTAAKADRPPLTPTHSELRLGKPQLHPTHLDRIARKNQLIVVRRLAASPMLGSYARSTAACVRFGESGQPFAPLHRTHFGCCQSARLAQRRTIGPHCKVPSLAAARLPAVC
jgi:hypothetical protein